MLTSEEVGRRIREAREDLGLSQADLGRLMTRPRTHAAVSDIERGKTKLGVEEISELAMLLHKDLSYFYETRPTPRVVYRRGDRGLSSREQRETDKSIETFKRMARELARRGTEGQQG